jgi:hypothetical protein
MRGNIIQKSHSFREKIIPSRPGLPLELQFMHASFLHGSSSAVFAFLNPLGIRYLLPTGILRKAFHCYPLSGELGLGTVGLQGRRKEGVNYRYISGYANSSRIEDAISYSRGFSHFDKEQITHTFSTEMLDCIKDLPSENESPERRIKLKTMQIRLQNLMLMDENWNEIKDAICSQLKKCLAENQSSPLTVKYLQAMIKTIQSNHVPFKPDERFRKLVQNQFPIVWVSSTLRPIPFGKGMPEEHLIEGPIDLIKDIQQVITPLEHVEQLRSLLDEHGLNHIEIHSYLVARIEETREIADDETPETATIDYNELTALPGDSLSSVHSCSNSSQPESSHPMNPAVRPHVSESSSFKLDSGSLSEASRYIFFNESACNPDNNMYRKSFIDLDNSI